MQSIRQTNCRDVRMAPALALGILALAAAPIRAQVSPGLSAEGVIFGKPYAAFGYYVKPALPSRSDEPWFPSYYNPPLAEFVLEPTSLRPEALALKDGLLYVAGDWNETQNQIGVFTTNAWGEIALSHVIESPLSNPPPTASPNTQWWGPEGMTFNPDVIGVGAGGQTLVTVEDQHALAGGSTFATIPIATGVPGNFQTLPAADDIAYSTATKRFYVLTAAPNQVVVFDANMNATGVSWVAPPRARGLAVVSATYGRDLTGDQTLTGDVLLVVCKEDTVTIPALTNRLFAFRSDGTQIGLEQDISWIDAALDNGSGGGGGPGPHEMEAIVVDETNGIIYIGDEAARAVYSVKTITPQTSTSQGTVFGRTWNARGVYVELGLPGRNAEPWYPALANDVNSPPKLRPEGMAFRNGQLYVAGDWNETQNQVAVYGASPNGTLTYQSAIQLPITNPPPAPASANNSLWGPEGLTFNTGATGYGAGATSLITVEDAQYLLSGNTRALLDPLSGALSGHGTFTSLVGAISPDDIAFGSLTNRLYVLGDPDIMQVWTTANPPAYANSQFAVATRSKGLTVISPAFAQFLLNNPTITQEVLLVVAKSQFGSATTPNNRLVAYTTGGGLLGTADLKWTRDAFPGQPLQEFECIAVDESNRVIYVGDEKAGGVFVLSLPTTQLTISTPGALPPGAEGTPYSQTIVANGGAPPYSFTITAGALPQGIALQSDGTITGIPAQCGPFEFTVQASDSATPAATATRVFSLAVASVGQAGDVNRDGLRNGADIRGFVFATLGTGTGTEACGADMNADAVVDGADLLAFVAALLAAPLTIATPGILPPGAEGASYLQTIVASGGTPPYSFAITDGAPPQGIGLQPGGVLSGTPEQCGPAAFTVRASDGATPPATVFRAFSLTIAPAGLPGDVTRDGLRNGADVQGFVAATLGTGTNIESCSADMNADGGVDATDIPLFIAALLAGN